MAISLSAHGQSESMPLLPRKSSKKPFYRARPLWLVPFAVVAAMVRGMTTAPRLEVFTQIACNNLYDPHEWNHTQHTLSSDLSIIPLYATIDPHLYPYPEPAFVLNPGGRLHINTEDDNDTEHPRRIPSAYCLSDPVIAGAARLQTIMITTMGLLSALTTGWWGRFSERRGRTRVLALSTLGLFLTDLTFIIVSTPSFPLSKHGHQLLLVAPIIEGLLGGYATLQSATFAYLSDCTSSGSRAYIFSRFSGVLYLGFCIGPMIGGWVIRHPLAWVGGSPMPGRQAVTSVFWVAVFCSFINILLVTFVFPESLDQEKRERAMIVYQKLGATIGKKGKARQRALTLSSAYPDTPGIDEEENDDTTEEVNQPRLEERETRIQSRGAGIISSFFSPLAVFLPVVVLDPSGLGRKKRDWSLTLLAGGVFGYMLSSGLYQMKYLYARHTYGWSAEGLSYYISAMGGSRAIFCLFLLPTIIPFIKPKPLLSSVQKGKGKPPILSNVNKNGGINQSQPSQPEQLPLQKDKKPKPTKAQLGQEIGFDLFLTRFSLMIDVLSQALVVLLPAPALTDHVSLMRMGQGKLGFENSQAMFVAASALTSFGSGAAPAIHSLALSILQVRGLDAAACSIDGEDANLREDEGAGPLFGAFAVIQAVGQMILGPMLFGLIYSETISRFPKTIFAVAAGLLGCALAMVLCVRNPVRPEQLKGKKNRQGRDVERGRSRASKDLRGGAIGNYGSDRSYDSGSSS